MVNEEIEVVEGGKVAFNETKKENCQFIFHHLLPSCVPFQVLRVYFNLKVQLGKFSLVVNFCSTLYEDVVGSFLEITWL